LPNVLILNQYYRNSEWTPAAKKALEYVDENDGTYATAFFFLLFFSPISFWFFLKFLIFYYFFKTSPRFYMNYQDFSARFNIIHVLRLLTDDVGEVWQKREFKNQWKGETAAGCTDHPNWHKNPQFALTTNQVSKVFVCLSQPDQRYATDSGMSFISNSTKMSPKFFVCAECDACNFFANDESCKREHAPAQLSFYCLLKNYICDQND
jgi:hypothetical protein